ncbi:hypothetical protein GQ42DRAFT_29765 [Ramicandelaber brevisporus]|nr:hypothetical protein GQ42DRAFT_29765 [Ramicandelaber brevisporus]
MIKESIPSSSDSEIDDIEARNQDSMVAAIERLKNDHYDNAERVKEGLKRVRRSIGKPYTSTKYRLAAKSGLIEAVARAIIMLHRFNELDVVKPMLEDLHTYGRRSAKLTVLRTVCIYYKELEMEHEDKPADILFKKQRLYAMVRFAHKLCKASEKLSTGVAMNTFEQTVHSLENYYPPGSTFKLVQEEGKLTLVVKPYGAKPLIFDL